ncbi:MAG: protein translocase subunit SecD [Gammaproteobacteria bacterium]|nr:protein translocase subunit SecD [Gammaproteobacteria bacterium]|tara:strand:- start:102323 stop:104221 length:1899 start_codon:yes stop_codon:yes gene_type:complete
MLNKYPLWKNILVAFIVVVSVVYAAPNFYPPDPAIQISHDSGLVDQSALDTATTALLSDGIAFTATELDGGTGLIRLEQQNDQARAQAVVQLALPNEYIVAQNMAANTPEWLQAFAASPMSYGLDLSGGVHFLMEVDMEQAVGNQLNDSVAVMRGLLREERLRYRPPVEVDEQNRIVIRFTDEETRSAADDLIEDEFPDLVSRTAQDGDDYILYYMPTEASMLLLQDYALQQNLSTLRTRVDALGVKEPKVQRMGQDRIVVELPGIQDTARAKDIISTVATLRFHLVAEADAPIGTTTDYEYEGTLLPLENDVIVGGDSVTQAQASFDPQTTLPQVNITLDATGARQMNEATRGNIGRRMAILLSETKVRTVTEMLPDGEIVSSSEPFEEVRVISAPVIQAALGRQFRITGLVGNEANDLALLIRSGALAAPMYFLEESTIGPSLGQENIDRGVLSVQIGLALVLVFMLVYYRLFGLIANIALAVNLLLLVAVMSIIGATLTLPGIAGIVLTVGMAVDANVLIFARIREELRNGSSVQKAIDSGYGRAFVTILDANVTTLLVAVILYSIGTGPVKGFAVTLSIGILTSMFTAIVFTRAMVNLIYGGRKVNRLSIGIKMPQAKAQPEQAGAAS